MHKQFFQQNYEGLKSITYLFFIIFIIGNPNLSFAQDILSGEKFKKGIYKNYDEFIKNSPSINYELIVRTRNENAINNLGGGYYEIVGVNIQEGQKRIVSSALIKDNFGYCDGVNIYIFDRFLHKKYSIAASQVILISRFIVLQSYDPIVAGSDANAAVLMGGMLGGIVGAGITSAIVYGVKKLSMTDVDTLNHNYVNNIIIPDRTFVIDTKKSGKISKFWYQYFLEIMYYEDEELYNEFQKIPKEKRQENLSTYFYKFIEKNK